jgi:hypothetical protein
VWSDASFIGINLYFYIAKIMETIVLLPENKEQLNAIKAFAKALKFKTEANHYNPEAVAKVRQGEEDYKNGKGVKIATADLWK